MTTSCPHRESAPVAGRISLSAEADSAAGDVAGPADSRRVADAVEATAEAVRTLNVSCDAGSEARAGVAYGLAAYVFWGFVPLYFKAVASVPAMEVLAHRVIWSVPLLIVLMRVLRRWPVALEALKDRRTLLTLAGSTTLIALNWLTFIWAVASGQLLQASLGYYINPLVNVLLGFLFLSERLRPWQWVSVALAAGAVAFLAVSYGVFPWVALVLAFSFGFYGLLRKVARLDSLSGLTMETTLLFPIMLGYWLWLMRDGRSAMQGGPLFVQILLPLGGVITAVPLLWFASAARRLRLATIGFMQYIAPTFQFLLAVAAFGEAFTRAHAVSFALIWVALSIYTTDTVRASRSKPCATRAP